MLTAAEIRERIREGLATGRLWRLPRDHVKLCGATDGGPECHACALRIPSGQTFSLPRGSGVVLVHLECYLFWLHQSGIVTREPTICACCRRVIPPHAERVLPEGAGPAHRRCWEREGAPFLR